MGARMCERGRSVAARSMQRDARELWMAGDVQVRSLASLKACTTLRKLDLRGFLPALNSQVEDLQLSCSHLAAPQSVELEGLVHELQRSIPPHMQEDAVLALGSMIQQEAQATIAEVQDAIASAGAIPALVLLLGSGSTADVRAEAAGVLSDLAVKNAQQKSAIANAGAIPALVHLLQPESSSEMQEAAALALSHLAANMAQNSADIADAGVIVDLVRLLRPGVSTVQEAARALGNLALRQQREGHCATSQPNTHRTRRAPRLRAPLAPGPGAASSKP
jgi:hypothetical protein